MTPWWLGQPTRCRWRRPWGVVSDKLSTAHAGAVPVGHDVGEDVGGGVVSTKASLENSGAFVAEQVSNVSAQILMCWRCPDSEDTGMGEQAGDRAG